MDDLELDVSSQVMINGAYVHRSFVIVTIAWMVATAFLWPFTFIGCRRAYLSYVRSSKRLKDYPIYWAHIAINVLFLTIVAIDPAGIFFDVSGTVNLVCLLELTAVNYSSVIYTFVGTVQHYIVQQKLVAPDWIEPFKRTFLYVNAIVGNILLITQVALDQVRVSGIAVIFLAFGGAFIGPVFCVLVVRLTRRLLDQFTSVASVESVDNKKRTAILKGVRKFRNFTFISTFLMYFLVLLVAAVYFPRLSLPASRIHSNDAAFPDFARHRRFKGVFKLNWIMWVSFTTTTYFLWRHWIKKSSFAGKLTLGSSTKTKSVGSIDSTTSGGSQTDRHTIETYSHSDPAAKNQSRPPKNLQLSIWGTPNDRYKRTGSVPSNYQAQTPTWRSSRKELSLQVDTPTARSVMSGITAMPTSPAGGSIGRCESRPSVVSTMSTGSAGRRESRPPRAPTMPMGSGWRESRPPVVALTGVVTPTNTIMPQHHSPVTHHTPPRYSETYPFPPTPAAANGADRPRASSMPNSHLARMTAAAAAHGGVGMNQRNSLPSSNGRVLQNNANTYSHTPRWVSTGHRRMSQHTARTWSIRS